MTTYNTRDLAEAIIGEDEVNANAKAATRTLRKFLRTDFKAREVATPGKGGRYSIDLTKPQVKAMTKRFLDWEVKQEAEANARREARNAATNAIADDATRGGDSVNSIAEEVKDDDTAIEGPTPEELATMLDEIDDED